MTNDLISREALLIEMAAGCMPLNEKGISGVTGDESTIVDYIKNAPAITAVPGVNGVWISFSERAPEIGERILWWAGDDRIYDVVYRGIKDYGNGNRVHVVEKNRRLRTAGVWMPRPKSPLEMLKE